MIFYSTNKKAPDADLQKAVVKGLAEDKGLYMPEVIKALPKDFFDNIQDMSFQEIAYNVADAFFGEDVPADVVEKEKEILSVQARNEGKPENIIEKMVMGRINKFYKEVCLLDQEYVKDPDLSVKKYVEAKAKEFGGKIEIKSFARLEKGEGLEKKEDNFADEVASMIK